MEGLRNCLLLVKVENILILNTTKGKEQLIPLQESLSKKKKGDKNYEKIRLKLAKNTRK